MTDPLANLAAHQITLPTPPKPGGAYDPVRIVGNAGSVAAQFPVADGVMAYTGRIGRDLSAADGQRAAHLAALNVLSQIHHAVGLHRVAGMNHLHAFLQTSDDFDDFPTVVDGASRLLLLALGPEIGRHTRSLFGAHRLPRNSPVELTATFTLLP